MQKFKLPRGLAENFKKALKAFLNGKTLVAGNYVATQNALVYRVISQVDGLGQDILMIRLNRDGVPYYLGNSSSMSYVDTRMAFGKRTRVWGQNSVQKAFQTMGVPMLPFGSFTQAGLKLFDTEIVDQTGAETVKRETKRDKKTGKRNFTDVHFTGATLFKNKDQYFLFDIDREEIAHGIFNPFIVNLAKPARNVKDAYQGLVPDEVRKALSKGQAVKRQGEHFFIKIAPLSIYKADLRNDNDLAEVSGSPNNFKQCRLSAQGNRDHIASRFNETMGLVSGFVSHMGREHADLDLTSGWWKPVPNTAVRSFTLTGDID